MDTPVVFSVVAKFELGELGTSLFHPVEHRVESLSLWMIQGYTPVTTDFNLLQADVLFYRLNKLFVVVWLLVGCLECLVQNSERLFI